MKKSVSVCMILVVLILMIGVTHADAADYSGYFDAEYTQTVESAFTFAFVGDTQKVAFVDPGKMSIIYDWIVEIAEEKNLKFVAGLGDITDTSDTFEWDAAVAAIRKMDGIVPYSVVRGNHDGIYQFVKTMNYDSYTKLLAGMYKNVLNTYHLVKVGTLDYLFLNLDHGPSDDVLTWACEVVEAHPKHNVIITTHGYINKKGEFLTTDNSSIPPSKTSGVNDPQVVWDKLVSKYENIVMVVCGHIGTPEVLNFEAVGDKGNKIQHVLIDHQGVDLNEGSSGIVTLFHFSEDGKTVQIEPYSTIKQTHVGPSKIFEVNSVGGNSKGITNDWVMYSALVSVLAAAFIVVTVVVIKRTKKAKKC